jgi:hypothetical protein
MNALAKTLKKESRTMVFVDLENACGGSAKVKDNHRRVLQAVRRLSDGRPLLIVYSTGPKACLTTPDLFWAWEGCRYIPGRGLDGADNALIYSLENEPCAFRSDRVILVSGDHAFTDSVKKLQARDIHVTVVAPPASLSNELRNEATQIAWLPICNPLQEIATLNIKETW